MGAVAFYLLLIFLCLGNLCSSCNNGDRCTCPSACVACESKDYCYVCQQGFYGVTCNETCKSYCHNNSCIKVSGSCEVCEERYFLNEDKLCDECPENCLQCTSAVSCSRCVIGYRGNTCHQYCVNCKSGTPCDQYTGHCFECNDGLGGLFCDTKCNPKCKSCKRLEADACTSCPYDRYGEDCQNTCSGSCLNDTCNVTDGMCTFGCSMGYWGSMCNKTCHPVCQDNQCNRLDGHCTLIQKNPGYGVNMAFAAVLVVTLAVVAGLGIIYMIKRGKCSRAYCLICGEKPHSTDTNECSVGSTQDESGDERIGLMSPQEERNQKGHVASPLQGIGQGLGAHSIDMSPQEERKQKGHVPSPLQGVGQGLGAYFIDMSPQEERKQKGHVPSPLHGVGEGLGAYFIDMSPQEERKQKGHVPSPLQGVGQGLGAYFIDISPQEERKQKGHVPSPLQGVGQGLGTYFIDISPQEERKQKGQVESPLQGVGQSLGAYYIDDFDGRRAYIVCKDPENMCEKSEFWEMVWNENCRIIVTLTETFEELRKNAQCPEENKQTTYGNVRVKTTEFVYTDDNHCARRVIVLQQETEERKVLQLRWPFVFHLNIQNLITFLEVVTREASGVFGPLIIHSSDGIIGCGSYLALDMYYRKRESGHNVDMSQCIEHLQKQNSDLLKNKNEKRLLRMATNYHRN